MKRHTQVMSNIVFWLGWPVWLVYFRFSSRRSRVLVVADGKILLIRDWLGGGKWGLPGGGAKKHEDIADSACRELNEEVGLNVVSSQLKALGDYLHSKDGLRYQAYFFLLRLDSASEIIRQKQEVAEARWFDYGELQEIKLNQDTLYGLERFKSQILIQYE